MAADRGTVVNTKEGEGMRLGRDVPRPSRPSPAMIVALIALVFAMTGTGIAAKTMISGKQIKDGSIKSKDLAKGAVKARNVATGAISTDKLQRDAVTSAAIAPDAVTSAALAANAVTSAAIAPDSVTEKALAPRSVGKKAAGFASVICANGVIVQQGSPCPLMYIATGAATGVASLADITGGSGTCWVSGTVDQDKDIVLTPTSGTSSGQWFAAASDRLGPFPATSSRWQITVDANWEAATPAGTARGISVARIRPNGSREALTTNWVSPVEGQPTSQNFTIDGVTMNQGDAIAVRSATCGAQPLVNVKVRTVML